MLENTVPQSPGFPIGWWLTWFVVAFVVYGLLAVWFWRAARRHDLTTLSERQGARTGEPS